MFYKTYFLILLVFYSWQIFGQEPIQKGAIVYTSHFEQSSQRDQWSQHSNARWVNEGINRNTCLLVNGEGMVHRTINLTPYRNTKLAFKCKAKAENVTRPLESWLGVKFMLHFKSSTGEQWLNEGDVYGSFDWKWLNFTALIPNDVSDGDLSLGLQGCTGKTWFDSISVKVANIPPRLVKNNIKNYNTNNHTFLRGVMSPFTFKSEDIKNLALNWNANLIRWQMGLNETKYKSTISNIQEYDQWLNSKLKELDSVLICSKQYGIKVVVDLHTPPGGRISGTGLAMSYNKTYNDHFIQCWQKIAKRYKGNTAIWGYDLVNEPAQNKMPPDGLDYMETQEKAAKAIKKIDKKAKIIFEVEKTDSPSGFISFWPLNIPDVIYEVHMYVPGTFTHQGIINNSTGVTYPGIINGAYYDKNKLKELLKPARDFQLAYHVPIYVGEFSAARWAPGAARYINDCIDIFEEYGWNWTYHAYREANCWDVEYENGTNKKEPSKKAVNDTDRKQVLLKWFLKNKRF